MKSPCLSVLVVQIQQKKLSVEGFLERPPKGYHLASAITRTDNDLPTMIDKSASGDRPKGHSVSEERNGSH